MSNWPKDWWNSVTRGDKRCWRKQDFIHGFSRPLLNKWSHAPCYLRFWRGITLLTNIEKKSIKYHESCLHFRSRERAQDSAWKTKIVICNIISCGVGKRSPKSSPMNLVTRVHASSKTRNHLSHSPPARSLTQNDDTSRLRECPQKTRTFLLATPVQSYKMNKKLHEETIRLSQCGQTFDPLTPLFQSAKADISSESIQLNSICVS